MIQVGSHKSGYNRPYTYTEVKFNKDGWADAKSFLPIPYDLMLLMDEEGKTFNGWYTSYSWDGIRYKGQKIKCWKRNMDGEA